MKNENTLYRKTRNVLSSRIKGLKTKGQLQAMEKTLVRHYDNGTLSVRGFSQLDDMVMVRLACLETLGQSAATQ